MEDSQRHQALNAVLDVIDALESCERGVSEISRDLGMGKSGVHKILRNLEERGYVQVTPEKKYRLGIRLWELGVAAVADLGVRQIALPYMEKLTALTGEGTLLSVYDNGDVVYLEKVTSPQPVTTTARVGCRTPAFCTATGKVLLAWQGKDEVDRVLARPLEKFNEATVTNPEAIRENLRWIRRSGYAVNRGEWRGEIFGIACPIRDHSSTVVAAISVTGPAYRLAHENIEATTLEILATTTQISRQLGWRADA